jgi:hypothetical protein
MAAGRRDARDGWWPPFLFLDILIFLEYIYIFNWADKWDLVHLSKIAFIVCTHYQIQR